jgi:hypothetical protein
VHSSDLSDGGAVVFFRSEVADGQVHLSEMVRLAERVSAKEYSAGLPYSTSHHWLCIGSSDAHVAVTCFPEGYFEIHYSTRKRQKEVIERSPDIGETERLVDALILRALLAGDIHPSNSDAA